MQIEVSCLKNGRKNLTAKQLSRKAFRERQDVQQEIQRLLIKHGLTIEAVISKYKDLLNNNESSKSSDIVKVLGNLLKLHNVT